MAYLEMMVVAMMTSRLETVVADLKKYTEGLAKLRAFIADVI